MRYVAPRRLWNRLMRPGENLRSQVLRGGMWVAVGDILYRSTALIRAVILSRLLAPADFGLLGVAILVQRLLESFTDTGISAALIQKRGEVTEYLDTAWTVQALRGAFLCLCLNLAAPLAGDFFRNAQAPAMVRCIGLLTLLWGLNNPGVILLRRELRFEADILWRCSGFLPSLITVVVAGYYLRNAWALMLALLVGRVAETVASYCVQSYRPRPRICFRQVRELMRFGRWVSASNMLGYWENQVDGLVIGRLLGVGPLGYYQIAVQMTNPIGRLAATVDGVLFPALCRLKSELDLKRAFLSAIRVLTTVLLPVGGVLNLAAVPLVTTILGARWRPACGAYEALVWSAIAMSISGCSVPALLSMGKPRRQVEAQLIKLAVLVLLLYPLLKAYGIAGVATAVALASGASTVFQVAAVLHYTRAGLAELAVAVRPAVSSLVLLLAGKFLVNTQQWVLAAPFVLAGLGIYGWALKDIVRGFFARSGEPAPAQPGEAPTIRLSEEATERNGVLSAAPPYNR